MGLEKKHNEGLPFCIPCRDSLMFWSDITTDTIHRANLDGSGEETLVDSCISTVGMFLALILFSTLTFLSILLYR